jgi:hypothetical protein
MSSHTYHNAKHGFSLAVPNGWRVDDRGLLAKLLNRIQDVEVRFVPIGARYPQLGVHVRDTQMKTEDDVRKLMLDVAKSLGVDVMHSAPIVIGGHNGHLICYRKSKSAGAMQLLKAAVVVRSTYYLFQFSSDDLDRDDAAIRATIATIRI